MSDDDRPKKSWREIDKQRDRSAHRREEPPPGEGRSKSGRSQKSYRAALDRLFDSGKIGELVERRDPPVPRADSGETRLKLEKRIREAADREAVTAAVDAYMRDYPLPDDVDVLVRVLEHRDSRRQLDAMKRIDALLGQQRPARRGALAGQLKMIRDLSDEPEMADLARRILDRL